jgi:hypothetical protein
MLETKRRLVAAWQHAGCAAVARLVRCRAERPMLHEAETEIGAVTNCTPATIANLKA